MNVLVPVRYPLTETNKKAIQRGIVLVDGDDDAELLIFHMNEVQKDQRIGRQLLRDAVESAFDGLTASYVVRDGFFAEEAIIEAAIQFDTDCIVLSKYRRDRWKKLLEKILDLDHDPEQLIHESTGITVEVITEDDHESSNA
jgi:nucleotide-binding universal stress UspA family protein